MEGFTSCLDQLSQPMHVSRVQGPEYTPTTPLNSQELSKHSLSLGTIVRLPVMHALVSFTIPSTLPVSGAVQSRANTQLGLTCQRLCTTSTVKATVYHAEHPSHLHRWTAPGEKFQRSRKVNETSKSLVERLIDFNCSALSVPGCIGSILDPMGQTSRKNPTRCNVPLLGPAMAYLLTSYERDPCVVSEVTYLVFGAGRFHNWPRFVYWRQCFREVWKNVFFSRRRHWHGHGTE